jgi:hypothetical protein
LEEVLSGWEGDDPNATYYARKHKNEIVIGPRYSDGFIVEEKAYPIASLNLEEEISDDERGTISLSDALKELLDCDTLRQVENIGEIPERYVQKDVLREIVEYVTPQEAEALPPKEKGEKRKEVKRPIKLGGKVIGMQNMIEIKKKVKITITVRDNIILVKGEPQLGKTSFMLRQAVKDICLRSRSSIIALRPLNCDMDQIQSRIEDTADWLNSKLRAMGFRESEIPEIEELGMDFDLNEMVETLTGEVPRIKVTLANPAQIERLNKAVRKVLKKKKKLNYNIFFDECDLVASELTKTAERVELLEYHAKKNFKVSATILTNVLKEFISRGRLIVMAEVPRYRGIASYATIPAIRANRLKHLGPIRRYAYIRKHLMKLMKKRSYNLRGLKTRVPRMVLINVTKLNHEQREIFDWGMANTQGQIAYILFNGKGTVIGHPRLTHRSIHIKTSSYVVTSKYKNHTHTFKNLGIAYVIQYLKDHGGVTKFPRIVIIAGHLAGRGISFVSLDYGKYLKDTAARVPRPTVGWRTQTLIYLPGETTHQPAVIQEAARCCGLVPKWDSIQPTLISDEKVLNDVIHSVKLQEDLIIRMMRGNEQYFHETVTGMYVLKDKVPKKRSLTMKPAEHKPKKTSDPRKDNGMTMDEFQYDDKIVEAKENGTYGDVQAAVERKVHPVELQVGECVYIQKSQLPQSLRIWYDLAIEFIDGHSNEWVRRTMVVDYIVNDKGRVKSGVKARLTEIEQASPTRDVAETTKGLLVKKVRKTIYMRYNM